jgi:hypothetical protein
MDSCLRIFSFLKSQIAMRSSRSFYDAMALAMALA